MICMHVQTLYCTHNDLHACMCRLCTVHTMICMHACSDCDSSASTTDLELGVIFGRVKVGILVFLVSLVWTVLDAVAELLPQGLSNDGGGIRTSGLGARLQRSATRRPVQNSQYALMIALASLNAFCVK